MSTSISPDDIQRFADEFTELCQERHRRGAEKYGPTKFLDVDTLEEAVFELADLANYARYTFIKVRALQEELIRRATQVQPGWEEKG